MMELNLSRIDYFQVGLTEQKTMKLLPSVKAGGLNRIAIGDKSGKLYLLGMTSEDMQPVFKVNTGAGINRLELGGPPGKKRDRIFVGSMSNVKGYSRKGKEFLNFNSNMTETIQSFYVEGADLLLCGAYTFNHYRDCQDLHYFLCADKINDVICLPTDINPKPRPILACQDRVIRVIDNSDLAYEVEVPGPPNTLCLYGNSGGEDKNEVLYGTFDGKLGLLQLSADAPIHEWVYKDEKSTAGVMCIDNYDITGDGVLDLLVGRDDGTVQVFSYGETDEPLHKFTHQCNESVTSLQGGIVALSGYDEIICSTYTGWCFGLTTKQNERSLVVGSNDGKLKAPLKASQKLGSLRSELEDLQGKVVQEREKYQKMAQQDSLISAVPYFDIKDNFILNQEDASYTLSIEVQTSIDNVLLQSNVPVDLLDVEKNSAVVSFSSCNPEDGNFLLATYRCQANTTRLEMKIRSIEGQYGMLTAYVTPRLQPKTCQMRQYQIRPLSLHQRTHKFDEARPFNILKLSGNFSMTEMHSWLCFSLPEMPDRCPAGDQTTFHFVSTFLDTMLECNYSKGEATFRSDNISTISILKDVLTKEATKKKTRLDITYDINEDSITHTLQLIHPKLETQLLLAKKVQLIEALRELQAHEQDMSFLTPEYRNIIDNADKLQAEHKKMPSHLERLYGMITDLFIDKFKFKGQNVKSRVPALLEILDHYELQDLISFFCKDS